MGLNSKCGHQILAAGKRLVCSRTGIMRRSGQGAENGADWLVGHGITPHHATFDGSGSFVSLKRKARSPLRQKRPHGSIFLMYTTCSGRLFRSSSRL
jgi:hypothetical protein